MRSGAHGPAHPLLRPQGLGKDAAPCGCWGVGVGTEWGHEEPGGWMEAAVTSQESFFPSQRGTEHVILDEALPGEAGLS